MIDAVDGDPETRWATDAGTKQCWIEVDLGKATGENVVNLFYYGDANQDVMKGITDATLKQAFSIDNPDILKTTNFTPNLTAEQRDAWTAMWAEVKAAP